MLITLMGNLRMLGSVTPPTPSPPDHGGGQGGHFRGEDKQGEWRKRIQQEDEDIVIILASWMASKNDN